MSTDDTLAQAAERRPRGVCPGCCQPRRLRKGGTVGMHHKLTPQGYNTGAQCPGVDQEPVESEPQP
jgi:hypothetical protein